ncbi:hypothetical protein ACW7N6_38115 [Streptomyces sp. UC1A3]
MNQTQEQAAPEKTSGDNVPVAHLVCNLCQGPTRPGAEALCGHVIVKGSVKDRRRQVCVVCDDLLDSHLKTHV